MNCIKAKRFWLPGAFVICGLISYPWLQAQEKENHENSLNLLDEASISVDLGNNTVSETSPTSNNINSESLGEASADSPLPQTPQGTSDIISVSLYIRVFLILTFLIVLIYFTLKFLRRLSLQKIQLPGLGNGIQVLSSQVLQGDRMLHVVEVGGECYLLSSSSNGVQLLDHYTDQEIKDRVILEVTQVPEPSLKENMVFEFVQLLRRRMSLLKPKTSDIPQTEEQETASLHTSEYRERLRSVTQTLKEEI